MENVEVARQLAGLRDSLASGEIEPARVPSEFEKLTLLLRPCDPERERALHSLVNELETALFSKLPENVADAMGAILAQAQALFEDTP